MTRTELKPCPFCGGKAEIWVEQWEKRRTYGASCTQCDVCLPLKKTSAEAGRAWNRRSATGREASVEEVGVTIYDAINDGMSPMLAMMRTFHIQRREGK